MDENLLKMDLVENDGIMLIMLFSCPGFPQTQIQIPSDLLSFSLDGIYNNYSMSPRWIRSDKITNERVARVGYNPFISNKGEWNN